MKTKYEHLTEEEKGEIEEGIYNFSHNNECSLEELINDILSYFDLGMPDWDDLSMKHKDHFDSFCGDVEYKCFDSREDAYRTLKILLNTPPKKRYVKKASEIIKWLEDNGYSYKCVINGVWYNGENSIVFEDKMQVFCGLEIYNNLSEINTYTIKMGGKIYNFLPEWTEER